LAANKEQSWVSFSQLNESHCTHNLNFEILYPADALAVSRSWRRRRPPRIAGAVAASGPTPHRRWAMEVILETARGCRRRRGERRTAPRRNNPGVAPSPIDILVT